MKLIQLASPFGVFVIGVLFLALGYSIYLVGLTSKDPSLMDSGIPLEHMGVTFMAAGVILYFFVAVSKQLFK